MTSLVFLIEQIAPAIYLFMAAGILWYWRKWARARRIYRSTAFELEREMMRYQIGGALTMMILLAETALMVVGMQRVVAPTVREDQELIDIIESYRHRPVQSAFQTPTRAAPVGTLPVDASGRDLGGQQPTAPLFPTATPTPVGTIIPAPDVSGCDTPYANLQIPANGMRVFRTIPVVGIANHEEFYTYKLELRGTGTGNQFVPLYEGTEPATNMETLWEFDPSPYPSGTYLFRLVVFDMTTMLRAHCEVTIYIDNPGS